MNTIKEKNFRQAAFQGNTDEMIALAKEGININSTGTSSGKTAAHFASMAGRVDALRLLINLGADFEAKDAEGKTPEGSAHRSALEIFELIRLAKLTFSARKTFYPEALNHANDKTSFREWRARLEEKYHSLSLQNQNKLQDSYERELPEAKKGLKQSDIAKVEKFVDQTNQCFDQIQKLKRLEVTLSESLLEERKVCACGEASVASYAYLVFAAKTKFPLEEASFTTTDPFNPSEVMGHTVIALNRDQTKPIEDLSSWKNVFIIDSFNERYFFYPFIEHCLYDTGIKSLHTYKIRQGATNRIPPFPKMLPFPKTAALYEYNSKEIRENIAKLFAQRYH